ncbi:hypothetical protein [Raoultibacter phocaeensis]|uniref:hypothetical protein n=1 Tax=Raoultibacter phocaeensis TaxID=2479841 RepID=UPI0011186711|nr:hypothetical protein [Raoultibacter phocaeensis]
MTSQKQAQRKSVKSKAKGSKKGSSGRARTRDAHQPKKRRWLRIVIGILVAALVIVFAAFSWDRWFRFDDAADIQGSWQAAGQVAAVEIDGEQMHLTDEVAYQYTLDTGAKTIEFSFGKLTGSGTYRFSDDRRTLTVVEGGSVNLVREFFLLFGFDIAAGDDEGKPTTVFTKKDVGEPALPSQDQSASGAAEDGVSGGGDPAGTDSPDGSAEGTVGGDGDEPAPVPDGGEEGGADAGEGGSGSDASAQGGDGMLFDTINDRGAAS